MTSTVQDIQIGQGDNAPGPTWQMTFTPSGVWQLVVSARGVALTLRSDNGGLIVDLVANTVTWPITSAQSASLPLGRVTSYTLQRLVPGGETRMYAGGDIVVADGPIDPTLVTVVVTGPQGPKGDPGDVASQATLDHITSMLPFNGRQYRRLPLKQIPGFRMDDYAWTLATYGYTYTYPQGFTIDWPADRLYICRAPTGGSNGWIWIEVYVWSSGAYLGTFSAGSYTSEGLEVTRNGTQVLLWVRGDTQGTLSSYDITIQPANRSRLTNPVQTVAVDLFVAWNIRNGVATVEKRTPSLGYNTGRNSFGRWRTSDWTYLGELDFDPLDTGISNTKGQTPEGDQIPKRQGMGAGDGFYVSMMGGFYANNTVGGSVPYQYVGPKVFGPNGQLIVDGVVEPQAAINIFVGAGITCLRTEVEGAIVAPQGQTLVTPGTIISLMMIRGAADVGGDTGGILFLEEFSKDPAALDFSPAARTYPSMGLTMEALLTPRQSDGLHNLLTGTLFTTLGQILDYMAHVPLIKLRFYTSSITNLTDLNGMTFPTGTEVQIENSNDGTFWMEARSTSGRTRYSVIFWTQGVGYAAGSGSQRLLRITQRGYTPGRVYPPGGHVGLTSSPANLGTGKLVLFPGRVRARVGLAQLGVRVTTLAAGGNAQLGIYAPISDTNPLPGLFVCRTASLSVATATQIYGPPTAIDGSALSATLTIDPDDAYWFGAMVDNTTVLFESFAGADLGALELVGGASFGEALSGTSAGFGGYVYTTPFNTWLPDMTGQAGTAVNGLQNPAIMFQAA